MATKAEMLDIVPFQCPTSMQYIISDRDQVQHAKPDARLDVLAVLASFTLGVNEDY